MPYIKFRVEGKVDAEIQTAYTISGKAVDVADMRADELVDKLNDGDLFLSLTNALAGSNGSEVDLFNFKAGEEYEDDDES